jgi:hypothetical protein
MVIRAHVESARVHEIKLIFSSFGRVNLIMIKEAFNTLLIPEAGLLPDLNEILHKIPVEVPSYVINLVQLTDLQFIYYDGYVNFAATPTFIPMASPTHTMFE